MARDRLTAWRLLVVLFSLEAEAAAPWTNGPPMTRGRAGFTATLLGNGGILATGGYAPETATAELYDPTTNQWAPVPPMPTVRFSHSAVLMADGRGMGCGGANSMGGCGLTS